MNNSNSNISDVWVKEVIKVKIQNIHTDFFSFRLMGWICLYLFCVVSRLRHFACERTWFHCFYWSERNMSHLKAELWLSVGRTSEVVVNSQEVWRRTEYGWLFARILFLKSYKYRAYVYLAGENKKGGKRVSKSTTTHWVLNSQCQETRVTVKTNILKRYFKFIHTIWTWPSITFWNIQLTIVIEHLNTCIALIWLYT